MDPKSWLKLISTPNFNLTRQFTDDNEVVFLIAEVVGTCTALVPSSWDLESSKLLYIYTARRQRNRVGGYLKDHLSFYALF